MWWLGPPPPCLRILIVIMMKRSSSKGSGARDHKCSDFQPCRQDSHSVSTGAGRPQASGHHVTMLPACPTGLVRSSRVYYSLACKNNYKCKLDHFPTLLFPLFWQMVPNLFPGCIVDSWHELPWLVMLNTKIVYIYKKNKWKQTSLHALLGKKHW